MGIQIQWHDANDEKKLIIMTYERKWTWKDFDEINTKLDTMLKGVSHHVDLLIDLQNTGFPPPGAIQRFKKVMDNKHENMGVIIFVGLPILVRSMMEIISKIYRSENTLPPYSFASNLAQARESLARLHQTIS